MVQLPSTWNPPLAVKHWEFRIYLCYLESRVTYGREKKQIISLYSDSLSSFSLFRNRRKLIHIHIASCHSSHLAFFSLIESLYIYILCVCVASEIRITSNIRSQFLILHNFVLHFNKKVFHFILPWVLSVCLIFFFQLENHAGIACSNFKHLSAISVFHDDIRHRK